MISMFIEPQPTLHNYKLIQQANFTTVLQEHAVGNASARATSIKLCEQLGLSVIALPEWGPMPKSDAVLGVYLRDEPPLSEGTMRPDEVEADAMDGGDADADAHVDADAEPLRDARSRLAGTPLHERHLERHGERRGGQTALMQPAKYMTHSQIRHKIPETL